MKLAALAVAGVLSLTGCAAAQTSGASDPYPVIHSSTPSPGFTDIPLVTYAPTAPAASGIGATDRTGITFSITATGPLQEVTYGTLAGIKQVASPAVPWSMSIPEPSGIGIYSLLGQLAGDGSVTCTITDNGRVLSTNTSTGKYTVVSCSGQSG